MSWWESKYAAGGFTSSTASNTAGGDLNWESILRMRQEFEDSVQAGLGDRSQPHASERPKLEALAQLRAIRDDMERRFPKRNLGRLTLRDYGHAIVRMKEVATNRRWARMTEDGAAVWLVAALEAGL